MTTSQICTHTRKNYRNLLLEQSTRQDIDEMMKEQKRRLHRQLEAAKRRQANTVAAAAAVAMNTLHPDDDEACQGTGDPEYTGLGDPSARRVKRANEVRRRRARIQAEEACAKVEALKWKVNSRAQALCPGSSDPQGGRGKGGTSTGGRTDRATAAAVAVLAGAAAAAVSEGNKCGGGWRPPVAKGVVIGGRSLRSTTESWDEQVRVAVVGVYHGCGARRENCPLLVVDSSCF